ncbi:PEP-CTERM sorting domain-containing protein [Catenovulum sp. SM1970]|uniref:PEP-CTERM sorting domain-containing protein n=1 Tax=Marinifaba aquimaris TaxID=2741323 RepID=UPI0015747CF5|nr:PEP-CTERM sorting domain-containing protein [Marinifaba aquimaris]NTS76819.1 PEP-CTERM sorting domain-containing protein [Marinifaba aquimaris]
MNSIQILKTILVLATSFVFIPFSNAGLITFEQTANNQQPVDNQTIALTDYFMAGGVKVRFGFDTDNDDILDMQAVFEKAGNNDKNTGFWGAWGKDTAAPGYENQLGDFFIRQSNAYDNFGVFTILYDAANPVMAASGEIWDIDHSQHQGTEQFLVQAFNGNTLLESIYSPMGDNMSLDAKPWTFAFNNQPNISKIEVTFVGTKQSGIGLAFNNFAPTQDLTQIQTVPEPETILLFLSGLIGIALIRKKQ